MKLHELKPAEGSRQVRNRVGRGTSSGNGKTAGRGQKGQKARSVVCQNVVSITSTVRNMLLLT